MYSHKKKTKIKYSIPNVARNLFLLLYNDVYFLLILFYFYVLLCIYIFSGLRSKVKVFRYKSF